MNRNSDVYLAVTSVKKCPLEYQKFQRKLHLSVLEKIKITLTSHSTAVLTVDLVHVSALQLSLCLTSKCS